MGKAVYWCSLPLILGSELSARTDNSIRLLSRCPEEDRTPTPLPGLKAASCQPPPDVPNNMRNVAPSPTHTLTSHHTITHTCCLAGANNSNSAGVNSLGGVLFCGLMLVFSWLSHWNPPCRQLQWLFLRSLESLHLRSQYTHSREDGCQTSLEDVFVSSVFMKCY